MIVEDSFLDPSAGEPHEFRLPREPDRDFEYAILDLLSTHGEREGVALVSYKRVAEASSAGEDVQYLVRLILEDEERHHRVFAEMANDIRSFLWEVKVEPRVPSMSSLGNPALLEETRRLLAFEKEDAKELRRLRKALRHSPKSSLYPLLVDLMLHDTAKHVAILEQIRTHLSRR